MKRIAGLRVAAVPFLIISSVAAAATESADFDADGVKLRYFDAGAGETVVLLHGFGGSAEGLYLGPGTFDALVGAGYRVIALDQRGHGRSGKPHEPERYGLQMVEDVRRLLDHLGIERVHLVGYSMGGRVANAFRAHYPGRLHTVTLGGYGWPWRSPRVTLEESRADMAERDVLPGNDLDALAAVRVGGYQLETSEQDLRANDVPALAIIGDNDEVVPPADRETLRTTMSNLEMVVIPGTHAGPDGAPYKPIFAKELIGFLARH